MATERRTMVSLLRGPLAGALLVAMVSGLGCASFKEYAAPNEIRFSEAMLDAHHHRYKPAIGKLETIDKEHALYPLAITERNRLKAKMLRIEDLKEQAALAEGADDWARAIQQYQRLLELEPDAEAFQAALARAESKLYQQQYARQQELARQRRSGAGGAAQGEPQGLTAEQRSAYDTVFANAKRYSEQGNNQAAVRMLRPMLDVNYRTGEVRDTLVKALTDLARGYYNQAEYRRAAELFDEAYALAPSENLGKLRERAQRLAAALNER